MHISHDNFAKKLAVLQNQQNQITTLTIENCDSEQVLAIASELNKQPTMSQLTISWVFASCRPQINLEATKAIAAAIAAHPNISSVTIDGQVTANATDLVDLIAPLTNISSLRLAYTNINMRVLEGLRTLRANSQKLEELDVDTCSGFAFISPLTPQGARNAAIHFLPDWTGTVGIPAQQSLQQQPLPLINQFLGDRATRRTASTFLRYQTEERTIRIPVHMIQEMPTYTLMPNHW